MRKTYRNCPLCGSSVVILQLKATSLPPRSPVQVQVTEKHFGLHGDIVRCTNCGFYYVAGEEFVRRAVSLYRLMSDSVYLQEEKERRLSFLKILENIQSLKKNKKQLTILDIGCSTGGLLVEAKRLGWQVRGVEPSRWASGLAKKLHGLTLYNGTMEQYRTPKKFDVVTILDVLEHVKDPKLLMRKVAGVLKKDGIVCIVTPDYQSLVAKLLGERWWGIRLGHLLYFDKKTLTKLVNESGFKIKKSSTYTRYFSLYYILVRLFTGLEKTGAIKELLKKITLPLTMFDSFEVYITRK